MLIVIPHTLPVSRCFPQGCTLRLIPVSLTFMLNSMSGDQNGINIFDFYSKCLTSITH